MWQYNAQLRQWEAIAHGWWCIVRRWANSAQWTASIEPLDQSEAQHTAPAVFTWVEDAQAWCVTAVARRQQDAQR
jgi:hypothetical protein